MTSTSMKIFLAVLLLCVPLPAVAKEWKGISPGISTRSDVTRLFRECQDPFASCEFQLDGDKIRIVFSGLLQDYFYECSRKLPPDTVLLVEVTPGLPVKLKTVRKSVTVKSVRRVFDFSVYLDEKNGVVLKTYKDKVIQLNYIADERLRCEDYYANPVKFGSIVTHCPPVTLAGPNTTVRAGEVVNFVADVQPDPKMTLVWKISGGRILTQSGRQLSLDTSGLDGQALRVSVQARGSCSVENSVTLQILTHP
jgi:hypothetical protein